MSNPSTSSAANYIHPPPLTGSARLWGTLALSAATFMNVLDTSIANVSLPAIAGDLGVSPNQGTWVITSFGVANAISVPPVSYTHLDVYKRQLQGYLRRILETAQTLNANAAPHETQDQ